MRLPTTVNIRYAPLGQLLAECQHSSQEWLGTDERRELDRLSDCNRRKQWLAGRWASKTLLQRMTGIAKPANLQILTRDERGRGVRPGIFLNGCELPWTLSISHTESAVLIGLAPRSQYSIGVDLAKSSPRSEAFQQMWYTASERHWVTEDSGNRAIVNWRATVIWTLKEAVYKAVHSGESWDPRQIEILPRQSSRFGCCYRGHTMSKLHLNLTTIDTHIAVVACLPSAGTQLIARDHNLLREAS